MLATYNTYDSVTEQIENPTENLTWRSLWAILSFQAGWINAGGFIACHRFVTHTTGFATQVGYDIATAKWKEALGMITVPMFFLIGSMISGFYVDRPLLKKEKPSYYILFLLTGIFLLLVTLLGSLGLFGEFAQDYQVSDSYLLIALLCLSSGMQNAATSTSSRNRLRTTHLTGHTTDLGISFVKFLSLRDPAERKKENRRNIDRLIVIGSFILGSLVSSFLFLKFGFVGFIIPTIISFALYYISKKRYMHSA